MRAIPHLKLQLQAWIAVETFSISLHCTLMHQSGGAVNAAADPSTSGMAWCQCSSASTAALMTS